jgi:error-prone DNA polymerase
LELVGEILGFPRHLSQHVGGMVITESPLCELVPIENAAMADRTVIQWDKNDLDELGMLKVDCLCLGMLTAIRKCFDLVKKHTGERLTLATIPPDDPATYAMIRRADTMGVFQIESRAQMSMLPRLQPRCWYDLVVEVAIVRPGPIQGGMVHPYLRRRAGEEEITYPNDAIREVLEKTLGVPIFQEQAMRLAVVAAGFTPGEADQLRRAMGAWRKTGVIEKFRQKLLGGMQERGLSREFAESVYRQIQGFGEYGFPESHAASFALLVYASAWLKCHHPAAFTAATLNSWPLGFYAPAQLIRDVLDHGVQVRPVDINQSDWDCTLEPVSDAKHPLCAAIGIEDDFRLVPNRSRCLDHSSNHALRIRAGCEGADGLESCNTGTIVQGRRVRIAEPLSPGRLVAGAGRRIVTPEPAATGQPFRRRTVHSATPHERPRRSLRRLRGAGTVPP